MTAPVVINRMNDLNHLLSPNPRENNYLTSVEKNMFDIDDDDDDDEIIPHHKKSIELFQADEENNLFEKSDFLDSLTAKKQTLESLLQSKHDPVAKSFFQRNSRPLNSRQRLSTKQSTAKLILTDLSASKQQIYSGLEIEDIENDDFITKFIS